MSGSYSMEPKGDDLAKIQRLMQTISTNTQKINQNG